MAKIAKKYCLSETLSIQTIYREISQLIISSYHYIANKLFEKSSIGIIIEYKMKFFFFMK